MAFTSGFHISLNGDRKYNSAQISSLFDGLISDGIFANYGTGFVVHEVSPNAMSVNVGVGRAWFRHTWSLNDSIMNLAIPEAELVLDRIDTVVLEINSNEDVRANSIKVIKGTPAESPVRPPLTDTELVLQIPLCDVAVAAGATTIAEANITNRVGVDYDFVAGIIDTIDISELMASWQASFDAWNTAKQQEFMDWMLGEQNTFDAWQLQEQTDFDNWQNQERSDFDTWFATIQGVLDGDTAGNLLLLIQANQASISAIETKNGEQDAAIAAVDAKADTKAVTTNGDYVTTTDPADWLPTGGIVNATNAVPSYEEYPWYTEIAIADVSENGFCMITVYPGSMETAKAVGMYSTVETFDGMIRIFTQSVPEAIISFNCKVVK